MNTTNIKTELQELIAKENDLHILEAIKTLLTKVSLDPLLKEKLTSRTLKSEQNIEEGKVFGRKEAESRIKGRLGIWR